MRESMCVFSNRGTGELTPEVKTELLTRSFRKVFKKGIVDTKYGQEVLEKAGVTYELLLLQVSCSSCFNF